MCATLPTRATKVTVVCAIGGGVSRWTCKHTFMPEQVTKLPVVHETTSAVPLSTPVEMALPYNYHTRLGTTCSTQQSPESGNWANIFYGLTFTLPFLSIISACHLILSFCGFLIIHFLSVMLAVGSLKHIF